MVLTKINYDLLHICFEFSFNFLKSKDNKPIIEHEAAKIPIIKNRIFTGRYSKIGPTAAIENAVIPLSKR